MWLGRLDVNGPFSPENCCWTTREEQINRRRSTLRIGRMPLSSVARQTGTPLPTLHTRLRNGKPPLEPALPWLTVNGETLPRHEWAKRHGLPPALLAQRLRRGTPLEKALQPVDLRSLKASRAT